MIKNFWDNTHFYCMNHEEPVAFVVMEGTSQFYACPKYMRKDDAHPDGHEAGEPACANRIAFTQASKAMDHFMKIVESDDVSGIIMDYTGLRFQFAGLQFKVLKYNMKETRIGVLNRRAIEG